MKRKNLNCKTALAVALLALGAGNTAAVTNFEADVNAAIDDGLNYARTTSEFTTYNEANGLLLLALLEKTNIPPGYAGLSAADKARADGAACMLMTNGNYAGRGSFYGYYHGQVMMALAVYAETGGPNNPTACPASSVRATIDLMVDQTIAAQSTSGACMGMWNYTGPGCDSSVTQFAGAGLGAAKGFYLALGDSSPARLPGILVALDRTSNYYGANGKVSTGGIFDTCGTPGAYPLGCLGHGYQQSYGAPGSNQQTASGTWLQLLGTGKDVNNANIQGYMRWLQNAYNYDTNTYPESWPEAYFYYLWSSSKAYVLIENGTPPSGGSIGPASMGTLPGTTDGTHVRQVNRDPAADTRVAQRGADGTGPLPGTGSCSGPNFGYYCATAKNWYYDYAFRLMGLQNASGQFYLAPFGGHSADYNHAYALLVLERAVGGVVVISKCDANGDGSITKADLAIISAARGKTATGPDDPRDSDNNGVINILDVKKCIPLVH